MNDDDESIQPNPDPTGQSNPVPDPYALTEIDPKRAFEMAAETVEQPNPLFWMPPEPEELASLFPEYKIEHLLGRGGMGAVYKAIQIILDRFVAIKLLPPELARADPNFAERFHREAKAMAALNHQNIVTVYNFGQTTAGHYYFVMEFVDGMDFHKLIHSGQLSEAGALNAVSQICDALEYAHDQGYVHRDIKPANIFINQKGILKIGDFGLAKIAKGNPQDYTQSNMIMGSLFYSAPEQVEGRPVDRRADIYSLGVMFYEMLTRDLPRGNFPLPSERVQIDVRLDHVVLKAMASEPERRYATATALRSEVDVIRTTQRQVQPSAQPVTAKPGKKIAKRGKKTSHRPAIITSLLGLLVVMIGTIVFLKNKGSKNPLAKEVGMIKPATPVVVAATTPSPNPAAVIAGEWIDLLALVDPDKDSLTGKWTRVKNGLHGEKLPEAKGAQHLQLPYEVPEEYDFRMTLTHLIGNCEATQILSAGDRQFLWHTASGQPEKWAGFSMINGKPLMLNGAGVKLPRPREVNRRYESLVEVRRDRVTGYVDGQKLVEWKTDYQDMSQDMGYAMPNLRALGVGIWWSKTVFHEIAVREVTGKGKLLRSAADAPAPAATVTATKDRPFVNSLGMKFVPVPGTSILMCIHETRKGDYRAYANENPLVNGIWRNPSRDGVPVSAADDHPVCNVDFVDSVAFCQLLSKREGRNYRLPTDREWSMAVGVGDRENPILGPEELSDKIPKVYPWGTQWPPPKGAGNLGDTAMKKKFPSRAAIPGYDDGFATTAPVMQFAPNHLGIYDLAGNVWESCLDPSAIRIARGGNWDDGGGGGGNFLSSHRGMVTVDFRHDTRGFRCVLDLGATGSIPAAAPIAAPSAAQPVGSIAVRLPLVNAPRDSVLDIGGFYPRVTPLKNIPVRQDTIFPPGLVAPLYGEMLIGRETRQQVHAFVIDKLETDKPLLLVDRNGNGDLRDDPSTTLRWYGANHSAPGRESLLGIATVNIRFGEETFPADLECNIGKRQGPGIDICHYHPKYSRRGKVRIGEREFEAMLYDDSIAADFSDRSSTFRLDLSGDGRSFREEESESFPVTETFSIDGVTYRLANLTPAGDSFTLEPTTAWVGKLAPTFSAVDVKGDPIHFPADYRGRLVLLHIWSPYRDRNRGQWSYGLDEYPYLKEAWEKYHQSGFELLGVCVEFVNGKKMLPEILEKNQVFWPQICEGKGPNNDPILKLFQTKSVPCNFLVDGDSGKVLAMATRGKDLDALLERIMRDRLPPVTGDAEATAGLTPPQKKAEPGFIPLLEAPQLAGWREHGPGSGVSVTDSVVTLKPGRNFSGAWWYAASTFSDFQLRLQFRLASPGANSGVMLRFALPDENMNKHYDVDISNDPKPLERTGAIMFVKAPTANPQKDGEWNDLDITAAGQSYRVLVNGILVNEYTGGRSTSGYIGLQLRRGTVQIRQLRINDLSAAPTFTIPSPNSDAAAKVVQLRSDFQTEAKSLDAPILALNTKYREYLETQKTAFQQAGNLKGVLAVDEELKRFEGTATGRADSPFGELKRLQEIYYKQKIELRQKKQDQYINLVRVYRQKAEDMATESTKAGRIEEAKQALAESDKFTAMEKAGNAPP